VKILLIEDDKCAADAAALVLSAKGFAIDITGLGQEGLELGRTRSYDVIMLDLGLPDIRGLDVLKHLRRSKVHTPILVLSGDATVDMRVQTLTNGADDYMMKPFHTDELIARLRAIARRSRAHSPSLIVTGKMVVNLDMKVVEVGGAVVNLTVKEYQLLECLSLKKNTPLAKHALLNYLYSGMDEPAEKIIDVFICKLRKKLAAATDGDGYISTVWGIGYELRDPYWSEVAAA
jgi:two-component system, cell cycle response regulator CtrA